MKGASSWYFPHFKKRSISSFQYTGTLKGIRMPDTARILPVPQEIPCRMCFHFPESSDSNSSSTLVPGLCESVPSQENFVNALISYHPSCPKTPPYLLNKGVCSRNSKMLQKWKWNLLVMSGSLRPHGLQPTRLLCPWDFPGNSTGVECHFLLQGIFPTQGSNRGLPHCRHTLYCLSHHGRLKCCINN